ncbi:MAG: hypothetical protein G01um101431_66 [Parcubacteria group bacterium Gr01-1014_31]|nr:MAG: hypothetical protein G01um101431_66 [Parcubacteria group bacterium Gr01-1014_31]
MAHYHLTAADFRRLHDSKRHQPCLLPFGFFSRERLEEIAAYSRCAWQVEEFYFWFPDCPDADTVLSHLSRPPFSAVIPDGRTSDQRLTSLLDP